MSDTGDQKGRCIRKEGGKNGFWLSTWLLTKGNPNITEFERKYYNFINNGPPTELPGSEVPKTDKSSRNSDFIFYFSILKFYL